MAAVWERANSMKVDESVGAELRVPAKVAEAAVFDVVDAVDRTTAVAAAAAIEPMFIGRK